MHICAIRPQWINWHLITWQSHAIKFVIQYKFHHLYTFLSPLTFFVIFYRYSLSTISLYISPAHLYCLICRSNEYILFMEPCIMDTLWMLWIVTAYDPCYTESSDTYTNMLQCYQQLVDVLCLFSPSNVRKLKCDCCKEHIHWNVRI